MIRKVAGLSLEIKQYLIVTGNYWAFTLTDGALRMLVVLYFHLLGYAPLEIALLFLFYEFFGVVTNLYGGWLGARLGLNKTMNIGLSLQIVALSMLMLPDAYLSVAWVMAAQAFSGIAKDLNKMSAKSAIKQLVPGDQEFKLYHWVATLTGSKNALKGIGFFLGGALLAVWSFQQAMLVMASVLVVVWLFSIYALKSDLGKAKNKPKFKEIFSKNKAVNTLSAARMLLFASRDVWFVIALPVYLSAQLSWDHWQVGSLLAGWVIFYGLVQARAPSFTGHKSGKIPDGTALVFWSLPLILSPVLLAFGLSWELNLLWVLLPGLLVYGGLFAINSSLHSFLIVSYAREEGASLDIGFYYMTNALGRLIGTMLSGWVYQAYGIEVCLLLASAMIAGACLLSLRLPRKTASGG